MKAVFCCAVVIVVLAFTRAEECRSTSDCDHVTCPENDYTLECHYKQCTCTHTSQTCSVQNDCSDSSCHITMHCVDGKCRCGYGFGGGK